MLKLFVKLQLAFLRFTDEHEGQALAEYALVLALLAIVAITGLSFLGRKVTSALSTVARSI